MRQNDGVTFTPPPAPSPVPAHRSLPTRTAAAASVIATASSLAVGALVATLSDGSSPMAIVGRRVVDNVPRWLKEFAISAFGTADKVVLGLCMFAVIAGLGALLIKRNSHRPAVLLGAVTAFVAIGVLIALTGKDPQFGDVLGCLGAGVAAGAFLLWFTKEAPQQSDTSVFSVAPTPMPTPRRWDSGVDRRSFFVKAGAISAAGVAAAAVNSSIERSSTSTARARVGRGLPQLTPGTADGPPVLPGSASIGNGVEPFITPIDRWYRIDTVPFGAPRVDVDRWRLNITGRVDSELSLSYQDLLDRHIVERVMTLCCVSNEVGGDLISTAVFLGVPLAELLEEAGLAPGAEQVAMTSHDGWTCGFPTELALDGRDALVALGMNGEPLPVDHGFPARIVVPGLYGYVSATKWVTEIALTGWDDFDGYWMDKGWSKEGPIKTQSRIDVPRESEVPPGDVVIAGVAWSQHRGISGVEISIDDGPWMKTSLSTEVTVDAWRQWSYVWKDAAPGEHEVRVRATDKTGATQTEQRRPVAPDGATGWHSRRFRVSG